MAISSERIRWNRHYSDSSYFSDGVPDITLAQRMPELPRGRCLEIASGVGANSLFLAKRGYDVEAIDVSDVAIELLRQGSFREGVSERVRLILGDARSFPLEPETYDLVICFRYPLWEAISNVVAAMKPGGMLLHEVPLRARPNGEGVSPLEAQAGPGQVRQAARGLQILHYEERLPPGDARVTLLARKGTKPPH